MKLLKSFIFVVLAGSSVLAAVATAGQLGAQSAQHPRGLSLRDESVRRSGHGGGVFFFGRSHRGGGPHAGK